MTAGAETGLEVRWLGRVPYAEAHALQQRLLAERILGTLPDQLLLLEHEEVVTLGRRTGVGPWNELEVPTIEVERGGEATWHGPGQLVGYPLLALPEGRRDLHRYLRDLEQVVIDSLGELGLDAERRAGFTGVWVADSKLCSIGVSVRRWVTWHGFSLNVSNDLTRLLNFPSCGLQPKAMGRVCDHRVPPPGDPLLAGLVERHFRAVFGALWES